jgi:hypothetical protein
MREEWKDYEHEDSLEAICRESLGLDESYCEGLGLSEDYGEILYLPSNEEIESINEDSYVERSERDIILKRLALSVGSFTAACLALKFGPSLEYEFFGYEHGFGSKMLGLTLLVTSSYFFRGIAVPESYDKDA